MIVFDSLNELKLYSQNNAKKPSALALGFFDGLHIAHKAVIAQALPPFADTSLVVPTAITFWGGKSGEYILSREQKLSELSRLGIKQLVMPPFEELRELSAEAFFEEYLIHCCNARLISCGYDYRFGKAAEGDTALLQQLCDKNAVFLSIQPQLSIDGEPISSSRIRTLLKKGEVEKANRLLGFSYYLSSRVSNGNHLGEKIGFPTINQPFEKGQLIPRLGVYETLTAINGVSYKSVTSIGVKPTIGDNLPPIAETHIIDFSGDLYGQAIKISFNKYMRQEQKFSSIEALTQAIERDVQDRRKSP